MAVFQTTKVESCCCICCLWKCWSWISTQRCIETWFLLLLEVLSACKNSSMSDLLAIVDLLLIGGRHLKRYLTFICQAWWMNFTKQYEKKQKKSQLIKTTCSKNDRWKRCEWVNGFVCGIVEITEVVDNLAGSLANYRRKEEEKMRNKMIMNVDESVLHT